MKKFNLNDSVLVTITEYGFKHLLETLGQNYIDICILPKKVIVDGLIYYKLQAHDIPSLFGKAIWFTQPHPIGINILIPDTKVDNTQITEIEHNYIKSALHVYRHKSKGLFSKEYEDIILNKLSILINK